MVAPDWSRMPTFEVRRRGAWYDAECRELGLGITARDLDAIEQIARRALVRTAASTPLVIVVRDEEPGMLRRIAGIFIRRFDEGRS